MGGRPPGVGALRVGCIGRRSPARNGGRAPGAIGAPDAPGAPGALAGPADWPGRGRWKIGCPRTGSPVRLPIDAEDGGWAARGGAGGGAVYTGRGPVCGTIMRRAGGWPGRGGRPAEAGDGLWAAVVGAGAPVDGSAEAAGASATGASATRTSAAGASTTAVALTGAWTVSDADEESAAETSFGGCSTADVEAAGSATGGAAATGGAGGITAAGCRCASKLRRCWTDSGVTMRGGATGGAAAAGGRGAAGLLTIALGGAGGGGTWAAASSGCSLRARMAFSASPGLEILERSILGRNSSPPLPPLR
jgi:hypothetical protein